MQRSLCWCGFIDNDSTDIESFTNSFTGTLHSYTHKVFTTTNFEKMTTKNTEWKPIVFFPTHQEIVNRYSANSLMHDEE